MAPSRGTIGLITGGASGIGKAMAHRMAERGSTVAILDVNKQTLEETAALSDRLVPFFCDVTDFSMVKAIIAEVEESIGPVDRFMHGAAIMPGGLLQETTPEDINRIMEINYCGTVNATMAMLPYMKQRNRGEFIVFGSILGIVPAPKLGAYGASKAATIYYMNVLMQENKDAGINFQLVCPPAVDTPLIDQAVEKGPQAVRDAKEQGTGMTTAEAIIDSIEESLRKNKRFNYPGLSRNTQLLYRLFPRRTERWVERFV